MAIFFSCGFWVRSLNVLNDAGGDAGQCLPSISVGYFKRCRLSLLFVLYVGALFFFLLVLSFVLLDEGMVQVPAL